MWCSTPLKNDDGQVATALAAEDLLRNPFVSLPYELLIEIFSFLNLFDVHQTKIPTVCKRFREICESGMIWKEIRLGSRELNESFRQSLSVIGLSCSSSLREITMPYVIHNSIALAMRALRCCKGLTSLKIKYNGGYGIEHDPVGPDILLEIGGGGGGSLLRELTLPFCFTEGVFRANVKSLTNVTHFKLYFLDDEDVKSLADHCHRNIQKLYLTHCNQVTPEGVNYLLERSSGTIRYLGIPSRHLDDESYGWLLKRDVVEKLTVTRLARSTVTAIARLTRLRSLTFITGEATDKGTSLFTLLFNNGLGSGLTALNFQYVQNLRDEDLEIVARNCPRLNSLKFFRCPLFRSRLGCVFGRCRDLRTLSLCGEAFRLVDPLMFEQAPKSLRVLEILWPSDRETSESDSRKKSERIVSLMPGLVVRNLHLSHYSGIRRMI